jgi:hypothetical protein
MYDCNRLFFRWLFVCVAYFCCSVQVEAVSVTTRTRNTTFASNPINSYQHWRYEESTDGTTWTLIGGPRNHSTGPAGTTAEFTAGNVLSKSAGVKLRVIYGAWHSSSTAPSLASGYYEFNAYVGSSAETVYTVTADASQAVDFWLNAAAPVTYFRFDVTIRNDTYATQKYYMTTNGMPGLGFEGAFVSLTPGSTWDISFRNQTEPYTVVVHNNQIYPPFFVSFPLEEPFWNQEDEIVIPSLVPHTMQGAKPAPPTDTSLTNMFANMESADTTNVLKAGFTAVYGVVGTGTEKTVAKLEELKLTLDTIATNTLDSNSNLLAQLEKNRTNSHHSSLADWAISNVVESSSYLTGALSGLASTIQGHVGLEAATNGLMALTNGYSTNMAFEPVDTNFWTLRMGNHETLVFALFPTWSPLIDSIAEWCRFAIIWIAAFITVQKMIDLVHQCVFGIGAFTRSKSTDLVVHGQIMGTGGSVGGSFWTHVPTAIILMLSFMAAIVTITSVISTAHAWGVIFSGLNPFTQAAGTFGGPVAQAMTLTAEFMPWGQLVIDLGAYAGFRLFIITVGTGLIVWWQVVPALLLGFVSEAQAFNEITFRNHSSVPLTLGVGDVSYLINTGIVTTVDAPDEVTVEVLSTSALTNFALGTDRAISMSVGDSGGSQFVMIRDGPGPWTAFKMGTGAGGILGGIVLSFWVIRLLKPGGETRLE